MTTILFRTFYGIKFEHEWRYTEIFYAENGKILRKNNLKTEILFVFLCLLYSNSLLSEGLFRKTSIWHKIYKQLIMIGLQYKLSQHQKRHPNCKPPMYTSNYRNQTKGIQKNLLWSQKVSQICSDIDFFHFSGCILIFIWYISGTVRKVRCSRHFPAVAILTTVMFQQICWWADWFEKLYLSYEQVRFIR